MLGAIINATSRALLIEVGTLGDDFGLVLGETAEVTIRDDWSGSWSITVGQASGTRPIEIAARRVKAFAKALEIGCWIQDIVDDLGSEFDLGNVTLAMVDPEVAEDLGYQVVRTYGIIE